MMAESVGIAVAADTVMARRWTMPRLQAARKLFMVPATAELSELDRLMELLATR